MKLGIGTPDVIHTVFAFLCDLLAISVLSGFLSIISQVTIALWPDDPNIVVPMRTRMDPEQIAAEFQTTHWSMVFSARGDHRALEQLLRHYWSPVYAFIRRQGYGSHDASDLTQEFLARVVIGRDLIGKADPARGRFRSFIKQSLRNFLIDQHRTGRHSKGRHGTERTATVSIAGQDGKVIFEPPFSDDISREFDREWAATIVQLTLVRLEEAARREDMLLHWQAFQINILGPALRRTEALDLATLGKQLGVHDATKLSNMLQTMKRRFRRVLREVVAETVATPEEVEQELADLRGYMGG